MRHFESFTTTTDTDLFHVLPQPFNKRSEKELLAAGLGATLYIPAIRADIHADLKKMRSRDAVSVVVCLEDSVPDAQLGQAEENLHNMLLKLADTPEEELPLIFVRPRDPDHFERIVRQNAGLLAPLTGFVFPKFDNFNNRAANFVDILRETNDRENLHLYYMPVIESPVIIHRETRKIALAGIHAVTSASQDLLLAIRIGATDMSSNYGLRRSPDFTVYDNHVVTSALADIINVLGRAEEGNIITGAVWEHFTATDRTFKPQLRETLFQEDRALRHELLLEGYDTFLREIQLDMLNGITGKTVIHPSHIKFVHSSLVVTHEEYADATDILHEDADGANASTYRNKMNEAKPHAAWARKVMHRAHIFGVSNENITFVDFLEPYKR